MKQAAAANLGDISNTSLLSNTLIDTSNVDPERILIECGITTPVLLSNTSSPSLTTSATSLSNDQDSVLQHHVIPGQSKSLIKKYS